MERSEVGGLFGKVVIVPSGTPSAAAKLRQRRQYLAADLAASGKSLTAGRQDPTSTFEYSHPPEP